jgi:hypothetical protein
MATSRNRLRVCAHANVLLSGAATDNPSSASRVVLVASELTLLDLVACERVLEECDRNLGRLVESEAQLQKLKETLEGTRGRSIEVARTPSVEGRSLPDTDPKDRVHLLSAVEQGCDYLVTLNPKDVPKSYEDVTVIEPGTPTGRIREQIKGLA